MALRAARWQAVLSGGGARSQLNWKSLICYSEAALQVQCLLALEASHSYIPTRCSYFLKSISQISVRHEQRRNIPRFLLHTSLCTSHCQDCQCTNLSTQEIPSTYPTTQGYKFDDRIFTLLCGTLLSNNKISATVFD